MNVLEKNQHVFFSGIGGIGMSGIADLLITYGFRVSGSDREKSAITEYLTTRGAQIYIGHDASHLNGVDIFIYSSAISAQNPERVEAERLQIPRFRRAEILAELMDHKTGIGIAGTHGKTTTTAMCGEIFRSVGLDPTIVVGGRYMNNLTNAISGHGEYFIAEADEYDRSFLAMSPTFAVITSVEEDHLECYGSFEQLQNAFVEYANKVPVHGKIIYCSDEPVLKVLSRRFSGSKISYAIHEQADYRAENIQLNQNSSQFRVYQSGRLLGEISLRVPGEHNVKNALAVIALAQNERIPFEQIKKGFNEFAGVERRFQIKGEVGGILFVDDYAHHPSEIRATLLAATKGWVRRVVAVFQPHLYTRTRDYYAEFARALSLADMIFLTEIYPAREKSIPGVSAELISKVMREQYETPVFFVADKADLPERILLHAEPGDMIITLGAGDIWRTGEEILSVMQKRISAV